MTVRRAKGDDSDSVAAVLGGAFQDYEWTRWTVDARDHVARIAALQRLTFTELVLPFGEAWVAIEEDTVVSAAMWMLPDVGVPADVFERLAPPQAELEGDRHDASVAAEAAMEPYRSVHPHYFLGAVGTLPSHQRRGLGRAVLEPVLRRGGHARLETCGETNVAFYKRLGFSVVASVALPDGAPTVWVMARG